MKVKDYEDNKKLVDINKILKGINERVGKGSKDDQPLIFVASEREDLLTPSFIKTNVPQLNESLGGGIPKKSITVITGAAGAGKTSLCLSCAAEAQKNGGYVVYVNAEPPYPKSLADSLGVDDSRLIVIDPRDYGEQMIDAIHDILFDNETRTSRGAVELVIVDSINSLVPKSVVDKVEEKGSEAVDVASRARMLTKFLEHIQGRGMLRSGAAMILVSQLRVDINAYGAPARLSGGKAVEYMPKVIIKLSKKDTIARESGKAIKVGHTVSYSVDKNSISGFPSQGEYSVVYGVGVDDSVKILEEAVNKNLIEKTGKTSYVVHLTEGDMLIEGGINALREKLKLDTALRDTLRTILSNTSVPEEAEKESE